MIDTAIKHFIYEVCIDTLFNGIQKNFVNPSIFHLGAHFKYIKTKCYINEDTRDEYDFPLSVVDIYYMITDVIITQLRLQDGDDYIHFDTTTNTCIYRDMHGNVVKSEDASTLVGVRICDIVDYKNYD